MKPVFGKRSAGSDDNAVPPAGHAAFGPVTGLADLLADQSVLAAHLAYLELILFQELSAIVAGASLLADKQTVGAAAAAALERHQAIVEVLKARGAEPSSAMRGVSHEFDEHARRVAGRDWHERVLTVYLASGFFHDFFRRAADVLGPEAAAALAPALDDADEQEALRGVIAGATEHDPVLADRLAMWGRRIMGDTILALRSTLGIRSGAPLDGLRPGVLDVAEQVGSELLANHSRRMNALGLAA